MDRVDRLSLVVRGDPVAQKCDLCDVVAGSLSPLRLHHRGPLPSSGGSSYARRLSRKNEPPAFPIWNSMPGGRAHNHLLTHHGRTGRERDTSLVPPAAIVRRFASDREAAMFRHPQAGLTVAFPSASRAASPDRSGRL